MAGNFPLPAGDITYGNVTVSSTATQIVAASGKRTSISIYNNGSVTVYVGDNDSVTTSNGMPIPASAEREIRSGTAVYGITASSTADVRYITEVLS